MPIRPRITIVSLVLAIPVLFLWATIRYDRIALSKLAHSLDQLSRSNVNVPPLTRFQSQFPSVEAVDGLCKRGLMLPPPLSYSEWLHRKSFTRAYIRPNMVSSDVKFASMEMIRQPVLPDFMALDRGLTAPPGDKGGDALTCPPVVEVDVAADSGAEDTEYMLFGLATDVDRLRRFLPSLLFSYGSSKAHLLVLVPEGTANINTHETYFRNRGLNLTLKTSPLDFTARYFGLVEAFTEHIDKTLPNIKWVSFVDDDTFFPSLATIGKRLATIDATKRHYIGSLSEASIQVNEFGPIAFGGAGVFVSKPLLETMHTVYQKCQDLGIQPGDQKVAHCIKKFGNTDLTLWDSLYQMDMRGEPDGMFESGRQFDSLHHWQSWYNKDVIKMSTVAAAAGRNSVLRRWRFDERITGKGQRTFWVLTNGYSMIKYTIDASANAESVGFDRVEKTWDGDDKVFEKRLGPLRPKDQPGVKKERWMLTESTVIGDNVHQLYSREFDETHSVIELIWLGTPGASEPSM
ncbi:hypothetical protein McanMca71_000203 [Microsporum canis]|uniref:Glycosyltransferase family 31 protein n=1 Tax=Arthroderma otae (strain ATCC MYA-4605 / CBS 113480) TaxID=554155 RepID=C5FD12_ARTOC|nr:conserved hypothetical protein [Microsporum canis CBS 113480]EEQ27696.1 conserved hypothetical protein [Microsporum canis CBS 113480]